MSRPAAIEVARTGRVGVITLTRPAALNALNTQMMAEVAEAAGAFDVDDGIGAIVVTGSGGAFAAGADIDELLTISPRDAVVNRLLDGWDRIAALRTPTVAAVDGYALGGGCELAMMCDVIVASTTARFGLPELRLGVIPGLGGTQRLVRAIGKAKAMDMILTGRLIGADEAERWGLVSRVVAPGDLVNEALTVATTIAARSLPVAYAAKESVSVAFESSLAEGVRFERRAFAGTFALRDSHEGMRAFVEKRAATVTHS